MQSPEPIQAGREELEKWLRDALNHLYDIGYLENHPLGELLIRPEESTGKRGPDLRKILVSAIQARKPPRGTPVQSPDWRGYQILEQHILAGLNPAEVAQKLNISRSLFFLEKTRILKVVLEDLWTHRVTAVRSTPPTNLPGLIGSPPPSLEELSEAAQLLEHAVFEPVEIRSLLGSLKPLVEPLAQAQATRMILQPGSEAIVPRGDRVLLRQVILSLVTELLQLAAGGEIEIRSFDQTGVYGVQIEARKPPHEQLALRLEERRGLQPQTARQLIQAMNGLLTVDASEDGSYLAVLAWLHPRRSRQLLLIDDHPDISTLFTRHLDGTGWEVVWASSAEDARGVLAGLRPAVIVLDVILPLEDGWEFLITLKADPLTRDIPVLVCSAINEPDLVRSLGAQGYLPKPFSAAQLVQALGAFA
jgi:CheY-like chemotaxis protein